MNATERLVGTLRMQAPRLRFPEQLRSIQIALAVRLH